MLKTGNKDQLQGDESNSKRRKLNEIDTIRNEFFENEHYFAEFSMIYNAISSTTSVPSHITNEISEFATGEMHPCDNEQCENEILLMEKNKLQSNDERDFYYYNSSENGQSKDLSDYGDDHEKFFDDNRAVQIFCSECTPKLEGCDLYSKDDFGHGRVYVVCSGPYVPSDARCECGNSFLMCAQHNEVCKQCDVPKCVPSFASYHYQCNYHRPEYCWVCHEQKCASKMTLGDGGYICKIHC